MAMIAETSVRLPGTLHGLLDAGARLYQELCDSDDALCDLLAALAAVERAIRAGEDGTRLLDDIRAAVRVGERGRERVRAAVRRYS
jgi:hypothetical protein